VFSATPATPSHYEASIGEFERDRAWPPALWNLVYAHHLNGNDERASEALIRAAPSPDVGAAWRTAFDEDGYAGMVRATLESQISQSGRPCTILPGRASYLFAIIGEPDRMFECLDEGVRLKRPSLLIKVHPIYDPYRDDPRFTALLRRMNLAD
jgi:hypothetical protein